MEKTKKPSVSSQLMRLAGSHKRRYLLSIILSVLGVACGLVPYFCAAKLIIGLLEGGKDFAFYGMWCGIAAAGFLLKSLLTIVSTNVSHTATFHALLDTRKQLVAKFSRMPMGTLLTNIINLNNGNSR